MRKMAGLVLSLVVGLNTFSAVQAATEKSATSQAHSVPTIAVLPFEARGRTVENNNAGKSIAELVSVLLMEGGLVDMVERAEWDKALDELQLSASGLTQSGSQAKLGKLIGAKILITGSMFKAGEKNFLIAKVIGTETSRVVGCSVSSTGDFADIAPELARKIIQVLEKQSDKLMPKKTDQVSAAAALETLKGKERKVFVKVVEDISISVPDPAAETELKKLLLTLGFQVANSRDDADFSIIGEAVATQGVGYRKFTSAQARVELSVYDKSKKLLFTGSDKTTVAGASYIIAAKDALGESAMRLAMECFPVMK